MNLLQQLEQEQSISWPPAGPSGVPARRYFAGRGQSRRRRTERIQVFEGVCIGRKNAGVNSNFTLRKISYGEGVETYLPLYSPRITSIDVVRRGVVRRAKLYYLRGLTGKAARHHRARPRQRTARRQTSGRERSTPNRAGPRDGRRGQRNQPSE